jgi:hypothetical protein
MRISRAVWSRRESAQMMAQAIAGPGAVARHSWRPPERVGDHDRHLRNGRLKAVVTSRKLGWRSFPALSRGQAEIANRIFMAWRDGIHRCHGQHARGKM